MSRKRKTARLDFSEGNRHIWNLKVFRKADIAQYIIEGLSVAEALRLYKETREEKYVAHIFFSNLGYFMNAIASTVARYGESLTLSEAKDYISEAYIAVREALDRFDLQKSDKILSYLSGSIYFRLRKFLYAVETREKKNYHGLREELDGDANAYDVMINEAYAKYSEERYYADELNNKMILSEIFSVFKEDLANVGIYSEDEMHKLYGELKGLSNSEVYRLRKLRKKIKEYVLNKFGSLDGYI